MKKLIMCASVGLIALSAFAAGNFVHDSESVAYLNPGAAVSSGNLVDLGDRYGVALADIASNATGTVQIKGVWSFARADTNAIAAGAAVFYNSATTVDGIATADEYVGQCTEAAAVCDALTNSAGDTIKYVKIDLNVPQRQCIVGTDVLAPGGDLTGKINSIAVATVTDGAALGTTSVQPADVWGAPTATPSPALLENTVAIQAKTAAAGDLSEFRLIRVWTSETSMGAASTNNIETLVLSTGTAVDTVTAHADYRYVTATDGSAVATITGTAVGTNYVMVSDGSSVSATAITFVE